MSVMRFTEPVITAVNPREVIARNGISKRIIITQMILKPLIPLFSNSFVSFFPLYRYVKSIPAKEGMVTPIENSRVPFDCNASTF